MKSKVTFLIVLFLIILNTQGQNPINLKKNYQFSYFNNDLKQSEILFNRISDKPLTFKNNQANPDFLQTPTSDIKKRLDSLIMIDVQQEKLEFIYDSAGKNTQQNYYSRYDDNSQWIILGKSEHTFDDNGYLLKASSYVWNPNNNKWENESEENYTYDTYGNVASYIIFQYWNSENNGWDVGIKSEYNYDSNYNLFLLSYYSWDPSNSVWILTAKQELSYDSNSNLILVSIYSWNIDSSLWSYDYKVEYTYDTNGNLSQVTACGWEESANQWLNVWKKEYGYDDYNNMIVLINHDYDEITEQWQYSNKSEYSYDSNNNITLETSFSWDLNENSWERVWEEEYFYDLSFSFSDVIFPVGESNLPNMNNLLVKIKYYEWYNEQQHPIGTAGFYYSDLTTGIDEINNSIFNVYPNPTSSFIIIQPLLSDDIGVFELYDIKGNKVISLVFSDKTEVSVSDLQSGIYFYNIVSKENRISGKLIKQ
ncbi:MAG: T9SS type A sorting domain-containing protein [Salinivirgaceae bacterium]|jgi:hypothetical protein|nr:T9SS type A sorting domain-containing protein [Bacteroidales bacterium]